MFHNRPLGTRVWLGRCGLGRGVGGFSPAGVLRGEHRVVRRVHHLGGGPAVEGNTATPMLAPTRTSWPGRSNGLCKLSIPPSAARWAMARAVPCPTLVMTTRNSSPAVPPEQVRPREG